ncbi:hypothetical protein JZ751_021220 [Albula glossodonta]|uniref:Transglutaminase C-terminal domain-containing protein n=1 Tax=Albula glossodonta TaxID=121402 RepID=A0A8T2NKU6_9TELE|nr:hypothetical protein JZ751_021220 [Albula glossodonta]
MRRPDLSADSFYDGWQVLDPTPQELSEGTHCCGPAPVKAVLEGHTNLKYDLPFVFAEVNADRVTWLVAADGSKRSVMADSASIGRNISTKAVGSYCRSNISSDYKYPEGSAREEEVFNEASRRGNKHIQQQPSTVQGRQKIGMRIDLCGKPINGTDIDLTLVLKNDVPRPRSLEIHTNAQAMFYNGMLSTDICTEVKQVQLPPNREHILGTNNIKVTAVAIDKEDRDSVYLAERNIEPENPSLTISVSMKHCTITE